MAISNNFFRTGPVDRFKDHQYAKANDLQLTDNPRKNEARIITDMSDGAVDGRSIMALGRNPEAAQNVCDGFDIDFTGRRAEDLAAITNAAMDTTPLEARNTIRYGRLQAADDEKLEQLGVTDNEDGSYSKTNRFDDTVTLSKDMLVVEGVVDEDTTGRMDNIFGEGAFVGEEGGNSILAVNYHTGEGDLYSENHKSQGSWYENHQAIHGRTLSDDTIDSGQQVKIDDIDESIYDNV